VNIRGMEVDLRLTFDTYVVGPANRLAAAAARRSAEAPGTSYNPLFLYSASGLGKSHILSAIAHHFLRLRPGGVVVYQTLEGYLEELARALEKGGGQDTMRERYLDLDVLLLDDVQFLTGQAQAQEMLLRTLDALTARGAQVVLASDRPPSEINGLDARLLSRFSGGLIVDIAPPDYETKVAILRRKAEDRGMSLAAGVAETMARFPAKNVRELQGALNRLLATQELEERTVTVDELPALLGDRFMRREGSGATGLPGSPVPPPTPAPPPEPEWVRRMRESAEAAEKEGVSAERLRTPLALEQEPDGWQEILDGFRRDVARALEIRTEVESLGNPWPEAAATLLADPDRLEEAESLLVSVRERAAPFPALPHGPFLDALSGDYPPLAIRASARLVEAERPDYNPLYVHSRDPGRARGLLEAAGRSFLAKNPGGKVAFISVSEFSEDFIRGISAGVAGAWRERWWSLELLLLFDVEGLSLIERAQEEFFHLFEALIRRGGRVLLAADRPPAWIDGIDERIRSRLEGGLVLDLGKMEAGVATSPGPSADSPVETTLARDSESSISLDPVPAPPIKESPVKAARESEEESLVVVVPVVPSSVPEKGSGWFPSSEKAIWRWPAIEDRLVEEE